MSYLDARNGTRELARMSIDTSHTTHCVFPKNGEGNIGRNPTSPGLKRSSKTCDIYHNALGLLGRLQPSHQEEVGVPGVG